MPVYSFLENSARKFPNRDAAIYLGARHSYKSIWEQTLCFAKKLRELGIKKGDRIGLLLPNCPQFIIAFNAIHTLGGIVVTVNPLLPKEEIDRELEITDCITLIILDRLLEKLPENHPNMVIVAEAAYYAPVHLRMLSRLRYRDMKGPENSIKFENLTRGQKITEFADIDAKEDVATILFTSGSTGKPKGVMLTHYSLVANALQSYYWLRGWGFSSKPQKAGWPIILCAIPFFHSYGLVCMNEAISFGCTLSLIPNPNGEEILKAIHNDGITHAPLIPRLIHEVLNNPLLGKYNLSSLFSCSSGGAAIPIETMKEMEKLTSSRMYQGYGLTEAGPSICATPVEGEPNYASVGLAYPDTEVKIVDPQIGEVEMPSGRQGEIVVRGPQLMKGYWKNPEVTTETVKEGWLFTGDIGSMDEQGYIYIVGRKQEKILADGHSVYPTEVEKVLVSHPSVKHAVAFGVPDPLKCSTDIKTIVVLQKGEKPTDKLTSELIQYCSKQLEAYEIPSSISFRDYLPMTAIGKIDRLAIQVEIDEKIRMVTSGEITIDEIK